jgi:ribulose-phosphate 3-epimerase
MGAPAFTTAGAVSAVTPPSTSMSMSRPPTIARTRETGREAYGPNIAAIRRAAEGAMGQWV